MRRKQVEIIKKDLSKKYVFLAGPRQSGKTTLAKQIFQEQDYQYLNYDHFEDRSIIADQAWSNKKSWLS